MGKYIKSFSNHNDYEDFTYSDDYIRPNTSYCKSENEVHYNPVPHYAKLYYQGDVVGETEICYDENTGYYGCDDGFYGRQSIALFSSSQPHDYRIDTIEIDMFNGASNVSVSSPRIPITWSMDGNIFRAECTEEYYRGSNTGFTITYTCKGNVFQTSILINDES